MHNQDSIERVAPAKLNLFLHVVGRRSSGYHELESLFAFTEFGDNIKVQEAVGLSLGISGPFSQALVNASGADENNLVLKAARALQLHSGTCLGAKIQLEKNLPIASGIGGGSADAAAALLALNELWSLELPFSELSHIALPLGADVPACLHQTPLKVSGIGEVTKPVGLPADYGVLLVNPGLPVSTPAVFQKFHESASGFTPLLPQWGPISGSGFLEWLRQQTQNDLEVPATQLCGAVADVLQSMRGLPGVKLVRMSGSGATCFALFDSVSAAEAAGRDMQAGRANWWIYADRLIGGVKP